MHDEKIRTQLCFLLVFFCFLSVWQLHAGAASFAQDRYSDAHWRSKDGPGLGLKRQYRGFVRSSQYLTMKDGIRIAVDLYLPNGLKEGERIPCILVMTPYLRSIEFRFPLAKKIYELVNPSDTTFKEREFAAYGYATVKLDIRGVGASFGKRRSVFMPDVVRDGAEVVDWIVRQPWSNGKVGGRGISALGMTALWMLTAKHPAIKAIAPRFTVFDIYASTHPGGLNASMFVQDVGRQIRAMDQNRLYRAGRTRLERFITWFLIRGLRPVDEDRDRTLLAEAVQSRTEQEYFDQDIVEVEFRDDLLPHSSVPATIDTQSPFLHVPDMEASGAAIYSYGGWYDGAFIRETINLYMTVRNKGSKLIIGPWAHGGRYYSSPIIPGKQKTDFNHIAELICFFDYHLKGIKNSIVDEAPIHYFTMGEEKWKSSSVWPPSGSKIKPFFFSENFELVDRKPLSDNASDIYKVDYNVGTGIHSRMGLHIAGGQFPAKYPKRIDEDTKLLCYTSGPLEKEMEVTGHPVVTLYVSSSAADGAFFVYLEDVDPQGNVVVVTDGMLRASHHKISRTKPPYWHNRPYRTFTKSDLKPLVPGKTTELSFDLFPVSYLFKRGHSIRIAIAGADKDTFETIVSDPPPTLLFFRSAAHPSRIDLPILNGVGPR